MVCLHCGSETKVNNSRHQKKRNQVWRRRECLECHALFTTEEIVQFSNSLRVLNNSKMSVFSRDKLFLSIYESCKHRKRAITDATSLTESVIARLISQHSNGNIDSDSIVQITLVILNRFDKVSAIHYQSYHS